MNLKFVFICVFSENIGFIITNFKLLFFTLKRILWYQKYMGCNPIKN